MRTQEAILDGANAVRLAGGSMRRILRGMAWGAAVGLVYLLSDLLGAAIAIGWLFEVSGFGFLLLVVAAAVASGLGAVVGGVVGCVWPRRWRLWRNNAARLATMAAIVVVVATVGATGRMGRNAAIDAPPPTVTARNPVPILWIVIDTLRADTAYGPDLTFPHAPDLGRFAREALVFADAESTAGWTIPSVAAMFTGVHSVSLDADAGFIPDWAPTIAERLRNAGYATHAVVDNVLIEPRAGFARGFQSFFQRSAYYFAYSLGAIRVLPKQAEIWLRSLPTVADYGAAGVTQEAVDRLARTEHSPLFLYVHYMDPHAPYYQHPHLETEPLPDVDADGVHVELMNGGDPPSAEQLHAMQVRYRNELRYMDPYLGQLLEAWNDRYGNRSVVVITADHGEGFMEHGFVSHGRTPHRELIHVPLLVRFPSGSLPTERHTGVVHQPVAQLDVTATVLETVGVSFAEPKDRPFHSQSWLPWLRGEAPAPTHPIVASHSRFGKRTYRYREANHVYIKNMYYDDRPAESFLYDLTADPGETDNLNPRASDAQPLRDRYEQMARALRQSYVDMSDGKNLSAANEESLRALGYVQ